MSTTKLWILSLCMGLMLVGSAARAQEEGRPSDGQGHWKGMKAKMEERITRVYAQLDLTDEQKVKLDANKQQHQQMREENFKQMRENMKAIGEELKKKDYDMAKIQALNEQSKQMHNAMADERLAGILEVRKILTDEQFAKFSDLMEQEKQMKMDESAK